MRRLLILLLMAAFASAIEVVTKPVGILPQDGTIVADITLDSEISQDNMESATYTLELSNPTNWTLSLTIPITFNYKPEILTLTRNGKTIEPAVQSEQDRFVQYSENIGLEPNEKAEYKLTYKAIRLPNEYGIWGLMYSYSPPLSFFDARLDGAYVSARPRYTGEIRLAYHPSKVSCSGCAQKEGKIILNKSEYFGLSWEKRRTPIRAGILYLLLLSGIALSITRARSGKTEAPAEVSAKAVKKRARKRTR